ncbi:MULTISPECIES: 3-isopropylmalate dehydrogenase [unclassified Sporosarcina]|uniref:3-isopropylmalate dehydrogenase n=1 Tax=unclassified Sporosarcina TaxID=2647733 RepID=UPI000C171A7F|nr:MULTISPECIES: 3-isopropylmalate dehydrogenase [unclassified Sporosarcina]PID05500.1 3-isopropylmalate dehydrogenase [Sporosarcina sp. P30]PID08659.1 3-isopropylmalate dehydrogenase [Sporosarcina sp. P31]PID11661.1 3-isopropylmalate dehydrogenase [Sporosarcina sp. P32b]
MSSFFLILMGVFIVVANLIGFIYYKKKKSLYYAAFTVLLSAVFLGAIGGAIALFVIRDAFAIFYGMQIAYYLLINSVIVFSIAILATIIKKLSTQ